jgi:predicted transcriptional regulator
MTQEKKVKEVIDMAMNFPTPERWKVEAKLIKEEIPTLEGIFKDKLCVAIFQYRMEQNITNQEFSAKLGMDPSVMSKIHNFKTKEVSVSTILNVLSLIQEKMGGLESLIERVKHVA